METICNLCFKCIAFDFICFNHMWVVVSSESVLQPFFANTHTHTLLLSTPPRGEGFFFSRTLTHWHLIDTVSVLYVCMFIDYCCRLLYVLYAFLADICRRFDKYLICVAYKIYPVYLPLMLRYTHTRALLCFCNIRFFIQLGV